MRVDIEREYMRGVDDLVPRGTERGSMWGQQEKVCQFVGGFLRGVIGVVQIGEKKQVLL